MRLFLLLNNLVAKMRWNCSRAVQRRSRALKCKCCKSSYTFSNENASMSTEWTDKSGWWLCASLQLANLSSSRSEETYLAKRLKTNLAKRHKRQDECRMYPSIYLVASLVWIVRTVQIGDRNGTACSWWTKCDCADVDDETSCVLQVSLSRRGGGIF